MDNYLSFLTLPKLIIGGVFLILLACVVTFGLTQQFYLRKADRHSVVDNDTECDDGDHLLEKLSLRIQGLEDQARDSNTNASLQTKRLNGLLRISEVSRFQCPSANIYDQIMDVIQEVIGFSSCSIHLLEPGGKFVYLVASKNIPEDIPGPILREVETESLDRAYMQPLSRHEPYRPVEYKNGPDVPSGNLVEGIIKGEMIKIPLLSQERLIGTLTILTDSTKEWFDTEKYWLGVIGRQLGVLIEQMRLSEQMQNLAVLQERERISQELHDILSQFVGTIRLLSERISENLKTGDIATIVDDTESIESIACDAYANIRDEMIGLRYYQNPDQEVIPLIRDYLVRFQHQWKIETEFICVNIHEPLQISATKGVQLFRILQEVLINVRRHSQASKVDVSIESCSDGLLVKVVDNGTGFDTQDVSHNRLGLRIMHERASSIGGIIQIFSRPGDGTTVQIEIPINPTRVS